MHDATPTRPARPTGPMGPLLAVGLAGLWILAGGVLKLLIGSPGDLPRLFHDLPLGLRTLFHVAVGVELFVGLYSLVRPARAWPLTTLVLLVFVAVLAKQVADGATSCGCFGEKIKVPPVVALAIDGALLAGVLASRPWRMRSRWGTDLAVAAVVLVVAGAALWNWRREEPPPGVPDSWFDLASWLDRPVAETQLAQWVDLTGKPDGVWFFWRSSCHVCAMCLEKMWREEQGEREIVLVRLTEVPGPDVEEAVHVLPEGPFVHRIDLPAGRDWQISPTTPVEILVEGGKVTRVTERLPEDCR